MVKDQLVTIVSRTEGETPRKQLLSGKTVPFCIWFPSVPGSICFGAVSQALLVLDALGWLSFAETVTSKRGV